MATKIEATLPDGRNWRGTPIAVRTVWRTWQQLVKVALPRGEGVEIERLTSGSLILRTVYAPANEAHAILVDVSGSDMHCGEPHAPELPAIDPDHPWPFARMYPFRDLPPETPGADPLAWPDVACGDEEP